MNEAIRNYLETLPEEGKLYFGEVVSHMDRHHPEYTLVMSYQRPTYKLIGKIFLMLGGGKEHFSIYTTDFDYVERWKEKKIKGLSFGKSAILFPFRHPELKPLMFQVIDDVIHRVKTGVVR